MEKQLTTQGKFVQLSNEMPPLVRDGKNPHFGNSYVTLDQLISKLAPLSAKYNCRITHEINSEPLENGLLLISVTPLFIDGDNNEIIRGGDFKVLSSAKIQDNGSVITYAKRYTLSAFLGVCTDKDDDGEQQAEDVAKINNTIPKKLQTKADTIIALKQTIVKGLTTDNAVEIFNKCVATGDKTLISGFNTKLTKMGFEIRDGKVEPLPIGETNE